MISCAVRHLRYARHAAGVSVALLLLTLVAAAHAQPVGLQPMAQPSIAASTAVGIEAGEQAAAAEAARVQQVTAEAFTAQSAGTLPAEAFSRNLTTAQAEDLALAVLATEQDSILDLSLGFVPALPDESPPAPSPPAPPPAAGAEADFSTSCGNGVCEDYESCSSCAQDCRRSNGKPCQRVGILYSVWHWPAWNAVRLTKQMGRPFLTVEDVLQSRVELPNGTTAGRSFRDIVFGNGLAGQSMLFHWQHEPEGGPYCIYTRRQPGELNYNYSHEGAYQVYTNQPDCPGFRETLRRHAKQLVAAGVDHVFVDMTNLHEYSATSDAIQLRPFEVLVEEWARLRSQGIRTPDIAAWQRFPQAPATLASSRMDNLIYPRVMAVYNVPAYDRMFLRDPGTGRKIFAFPVFPGFDPAFTANIQSNGGRNDLVTVPMWVGGQGQGEWSFMAFCQAPGFITDAACAQPATANTQVIGGSQIAVSPSYQINWGSTPWNSAGTWEGLTLRKQFEKAFQVQPDWLLLSGWNEFIAQPTVAPQHSMGLETDGTIGNLGFVDTYGSAFGRDMEPTVESGDYLYQMMTSCVRVWRTGARSCNDTTEACCQGGNFGARFQYYTNYKDGTFGMYSGVVGADATRQPLYACSLLPPGQFNPPPPPSPPPAPPSSTPGAPEPQDAPPRPPRMRRPHMWHRAAPPLSPPTTPPPGNVTPPPGVAGGLAGGSGGRTALKPATNRPTARKPGLRKPTKSKPAKPHWPLRPAARPAANPTSRTKQPVRRTPARSRAARRPSKQPAKPQPSPKRPSKKRPQTPTKAAGRKPTKTAAKPAGKRPHKPTKAARKRPTNRRPHKPTKAAGSKPAKRSKPTRKRPQRPTKYVRKQPTKSLPRGKPAKPSKPQKPAKPVKKRPTRRRPHKPTKAVRRKPVRPAARRPHKPAKPAQKRPTKTRPQRLTAARRKPVARRRPTKTIPRSKPMRKRATVKDKRKGAAGRRRQLMAAPGGQGFAFLSTNPLCEGRFGERPQAQLVGYIASVKGHGFLRTLRRCSNPGGGLRYGVSGSCPAGLAFDGVLGYVR